MNNYYPPVQICNNNYTDNTNNYLMKYQIFKDQIAQQTPLNAQQYRIGNEYISLLNKPIKTYNTNLYAPIKKMVPIETKLKNINTINNKCGLNINISPDPYIEQAKPINKCIYNNNIYNKCTPSKKKLIQKNRWNDFSKIDQLTKKNINNLRYYEDINTIPYMLNSVSISKPSTYCENKNECEPLFNQLTKKKSFYVS